MHFSDPDNLSPFSYSVSDVYNKVDAISLEQLDKLAREPHSTVISCEMDLNLDGLIDRIWEASVC